MKKINEQDKKVLLSMLDLMDEAQLRCACQELIKSAEQEQMSVIAFSLGAGMSGGKRKTNDQQSDGG